MGYDSRRWTGLYEPGQTPPEFAGGRPYRDRRLRWWLLISVVASIAVAIGQLWVSNLQGSGGLLALSAFSAAGRSPFARGGRKADRYDEFERAAVMQATDRAYTVLTGLAMTAFAWCALASAYGWPMPRRWDDWAIWAFALAAIASNLPALFAEFAIPFPAEDDGS